MLKKKIKIMETKDVVHASTRKNLLKRMERIRMEKRRMKLKKRMKRIMEMVLMLKCDLVWCEACGM